MPKQKQQFGFEIMLHYAAIYRHQTSKSRRCQIPSLILIALQSLEQRLEIPSTKAIEVVPLNNLNENSRSIKQMLGNTISMVSSHHRQNRTYLSEQLQQIPTLIKINQYPQSSQRFEILLQLHPRPFQLLLHGNIITFWDSNEFNTSLSQIRYSRDDICCS